MGGNTVLFHTGAESDHLVVDFRIVALDDPELRHGLAGDGFDLTELPIARIGLGDLVDGIVLEGDGYQVAYRLGQVNLRELAYFAGYFLIYVPITLGFPGRRHGGLHGVDEGMQVGGIQVCLLVPGGGRKDQVGVEGGGVHAEVEVHHQVDLAGGRFRAVFDFIDIALGQLGCHLVGVGAKIVLEHVFVALHAGADGIAAPDEPDTRPVLGGVG